MTFKTNSILFTALSLISLAILSGCSEDDPFEQLTNLGEIDQPVAEVNQGSGILPELSHDENLGSEQVGENIRLDEITPDSGVDFTYRNDFEAGNNSILESLGGGVAVFDFDQNGTLDIFFPGGGRYEGKENDKITGLPGALYTNRGDATFENVASVSYTDNQTLYTHGCQVGDFDNDGFPDFVLTGWNRLLLFHNQGDGTFLEIHEPAGLDNTLWSSSGAWGDYNGDGFLDLYVCNYVNWSFDNHPYCDGPTPSQREICPPKEFEPLPDNIYYSNGDGTFFNAREFAQLNNLGKGLGVMSADYDLDGDIDI